MMYSKEPKVLKILTGVVHNELQTTGHNRFEN